MQVEPERTQTITQAKYEALNPFKRHMVIIKIALAARQPTNGPQAQNAAGPKSVGSASSSGSMGASGDSGRLESEKE